MGRTTKYHNVSELAKGLGVCHDFVEDQYEITMRISRAVCDASGGWVLPMKERLPASQKDVVGVRVGSGAMGPKAMRFPFTLTEFWDVVAEVCNES